MNPTAHRARAGESNLDFLGTAQFSTRTIGFVATLQRIAVDALGAERARQRWIRAAHRSTYQLLRSLVVAEPMPTPHDRVRAAAQVFEWLGLGSLECTLTRTGGRATGADLFEAAVSKREAASDAFTAGYLAAATEVAHDLTPGSIACREVECVAAGGRQCRFELSPASEMFGARGVVLMAAVDALHPLPETPTQARIAAATEGLRGGLQPASAGPRDVLGLEQPTTLRLLESAHCRLVYALVAGLEEQRPAALPALGVLLAEAVRADVLAIAGSVLASELWEELESPASDPLAAIVGTLAVAGLCGHGTVALDAHDGPQRIVLRSGGSSLSLHGRLVEQRPLPFPDPTLAGIGMAALDLAYAAAGPRARAYEARSLSSTTAGDEHDRLEVELASPG